MKKLHFILAPAIVLFACKGKNTSQQDITTGADTALTAAAVMPEELHTDLYGNWVGDYAVTKADPAKLEEVTTISKLNIVIKQITNVDVTAQSIVNGNSRLMMGKMTQKGDSLFFVMNEPGDHKYDGVFSFTIVNDTLSGEWQPYDKALATKKTEYLLTRKPFLYNAALMLPDDWEYVDYVNFKEKKESYKDDQTGTVDTFINTVYRAASDKVYLINSSLKKLTEKDVKNLRKLDLQILRNTIFARHGYAFKSRSVRQFFDQVDWYVPVSDNIENELTALEKENISLLNRFEKYAEDNYDTFGR